MSVLYHPHRYTQRPSKTPQDPATPQYTHIYTVSGTPNAPQGLSEGLEGVPNLLEGTYIFVSFIGSHRSS